MILRAHAKLTLSLRVVGRRPDGYHDLEALVVSLAGLADEVEVTRRDEPGVTLDVTGPAVTGVPTDDSNLAVRAARLFLERTAAGAGVHVRLHKAIPAGAGLGGGSADAAAVLHALAAGVDVSALAAELGSDVPFCLRGGLAWMRGRGELLEPLDAAEGWWVVVAVPPFAVSTAAVYAAWDDLGGPRSDRRVDDLVNDLEPAALAVEPRLEAFRGRLGDASGREPLLAGSGSAYFVVAGNVEEARRLAEALSPHAALTVASGTATAGVTPAGE